MRLYHTYHTKCRGITGDQNQPPSAPPSAITTMPTTQKQNNWELCYINEIKVDFSLCHTCHAKNRGQFYIRLRFPWQARHLWHSLPLLG